MSEAVKKREFLSRAALVTGSIALCGIHAFLAQAQGVTFRLRPKNSTGRQRLGPAKRLSKLRLSKLDDAYKLANRRYEIEVLR